jgi:hypothetical protein
MNKAITVSSIFAIAFLSACGGSGTDNNVNTTPVAFPGGVNGVDPVAKLTLNQPRSIKILSRTVLYTSEGGYDGDLHYVTQGYANGTSNEIFQLATDISSLGIKDVQRDKSVDFSCDDGSKVRVKTYSDFSSGLITTTGTHNGLSIECESQFPSLLPTTVFDRDSITSLLHGWGSEYAGADYSNCTHQIEDMNGFSKNCTGEELVNYSITDTAGEVHKLTTKVSFK